MQMQERSFQGDLTYAIIYTSFVAWNLKGFMMIQASSVLQSLEKYYSQCNCLAGLLLPPGSSLMFGEAAAPMPPFLPGMPLPGEMPLSKEEFMRMKEEMRRKNDSSRRRSPSRSPSRSRSRSRNSDRWRRGRESRSPRRRDSPRRTNRHRRYCLCSGLTDFHHICQ